MRSMMVCNRRAPMFCTCSFTSDATFATSLMALVVNSNSMPSVRSSACCCSTRLDCVSEDAEQVALGQRLELHANGQPALQLGQQVGRLARVERARRNEQDLGRVDVA